MINFLRLECSENATITKMKTYLQITLYRLNRIYLEIHMYTYMYMHTKTVNE